ncbi:hypothetical protein [Nonomuraea roseoviolacea]|uniref:Integral membrane protein n=1 Tax=Nonomuraea roseoviolacea subsp. carminata TaxID=160689 RepID=A0ABT1JRC8_9ACTN|nr:hypothetical protein [Nonomuraea roseoviolacea]MCP2344306.1 hypothetical protein [Nonomuraea roseoviolacea subsp. carminata]
MLRIARAALYAAVPAECLLAVLLVSGIRPPAVLLAGAETAAALVFALEAAVAGRLYLAGRRAGAGRRAALSATLDALVPPVVRRLVVLEARGVAALVLFVARRGRPRVPPGAVAGPYAGEQAALQLVLAFALAVETVVVDLLLVSFGVPAAVRLPVLLIDAYGVLFALALVASCALRPHLVSRDELRVRYGEYLDLRVPRELIASAAVARSYDEKRVVAVEDGRLRVAVGSQTNVAVELSAPVTVVRPLGGRAEVTSVRFFAADPAAVVRALRPAPVP